METKTLFLGNLPWSATDTELAELVGAHTVVAGARVARNSRNGRSLGYGFVDVPAADAAALVSQLNGIQFGGRELRVDLGNPPRKAQG